MYLELAKKCFNLNFMLFLAVLIVGIFCSVFSSEQDVSLTEQNKKMYTLSIITLIVGIVIVIISFKNAFLTIFSPTMMLLSSEPTINWSLFLIGGIIIASSSFSIDKYLSKISEENKADINVKLSIVLSVLPSAVMAFLLGTYYKEIELDSSSFKKV